MASVVCNLLHFNFLLWNHEATWNQIWQERTFDDPPQSFFSFFLYYLKSTTETRGQKMLFCLFLYEAFIFRLILMISLGQVTNRNYLFHWFFSWYWISFVMIIKYLHYFFVNPIYLGDIILRFICFSNTIYDYRC